jgi:hypothetical protein
MFQHAICYQKIGFQKINGYNYYVTWHQIIGFKKQMDITNMPHGNMLFCHVSYFKTI